MATARDSASGGGVPGEAVKREVRTETIGSGPDAITKVITVETRTMPDGSVETTTTEEVTRNVRRGSLPAGQLGGSLTPSQSRRHSSVISSISQASSVPAIQSADEFIADVVKAHNVYRNKHGRVPPLVHNEDLTVLAQRWAAHLASIRALQHNNDSYRGQPLGQNVAAKSSTAPTEYTGQEVVDQWYSEINRFDWNTPEGRPGVTTGHFTQVIWRGSREIGVGKARSPDGREVYVVCNYYPAGNYIGRFKENVIPAK